MQSTLFRKLPALLVIGLASCPAFAQTPTPAQEKAVARFHAADKNKDGFLSKEEAEQGMPRLAKYFASIDTNQDGRISLTELQTIRDKNRASARP